MKMRIIISGLLLAMLLAVPALGQGDNENAVWNVYCTGDRSQCTVAKEPTGEFMFNVFPGKVTWNDAQAWMTSNGNINRPAVWNVYCTGDRSQCTVAKEPTGEFMFNVFPGKVTWDDAQAWMTSNGNINRPAVWNVYCTGDRSQCTVAKEPTGEFMFNVFPGKVTWDDAQAWMTSNGNIESTPDLNVNGNWYMGGPYNVGMPCQIIQQGSALTIINENGARSTGRVIDGVTVKATDWEGGLRGTISADGNRIDWANGTWWVRQIQ